MLREEEKAAEASSKTIKADSAAEIKDQTVYGKFTEDDLKAKKRDSFNQYDQEVDSDTGLETLKGEDDGSKISSQ